MGKFSSNFTELTQPIMGGTTEFETCVALETGTGECRPQVKEELVKLTTCTATLFSPEVEAKVSADASLFGMGAVLLQAEGREWKPVSLVPRPSPPRAKLLLGYVVQGEGLGTRLEAGSVRLNVDVADREEVRAN